MTLPAPRGAEGGQGALTGFIAESLRRLEDVTTQGFRDVNRQLSELPRQYVARGDFDRYRDERAVEFQSAQQNHDRDVEALKADARERAAQSASHRKWLVGFGVSAAVGIASDVIAAFALHH